MVSPGAKRSAVTRRSASTSGALHRGKICRIESVAFTTRTRFHCSFVTGRPSYRAGYSRNSTKERSTPPDPFIRDVRGARCLFHPSATRQRYVTIHSQLHRRRSIPCRSARPIVRNHRRVCVRPYFSPRGSEKTTRFGRGRNRASRSPTRSLRSRSATATERARPMRVTPFNR